MSSKKENRTLVEAKAVQDAISEEAARKASATVLQETNLDLHDYTIFVSKDKENVAFSIRAGGQEIKANRDKTGQHLIFRVPNKIVASFKLHPFVLSKRLIVAEVDR